MISNLTKKIPASTSGVALHAPSTILMDGGLSWMLAKLLHL